MEKIFWKQNRIDLVRDSRDGKVYVVEVNEAPEFRVMEKRTGKNIAKMIVEYLVGKGSKMKDF